MSFDPNSVERVTANACFPNDLEGDGKYWDYDVIKAEDYDALLALYRDAVKTKWPTMRCPVCKKSVAIRPTGKINTHRDEFGDYCAANMATP